MGRTMPLQIPIEVARRSILGKQGLWPGRRWRATGTLVVNGLWLEEDGLARHAAFADALPLGMALFARFLGARRVDTDAVREANLRSAMGGGLRVRG